MTSGDDEDRPRVEDDSDSGDADRTRVAGQASESEDQEAVLETVLADEDDGRTELVTRVDSAFAGDAESGTEDGAAAKGATAAVATRALEDKTKPPAALGRAAETGSPGPRPAVRPAASPEAARPGDDAIGLTPGSVLFGEYEIVNVLGVGGMGEVYRARHRRLDEFRAIKVMHAELSKKKGASEFFDREAKALLAVRHPAVVHCHDLLSDESGHVYLIMEMIEGIPLSKRMSDGPLRPDEVAILGARVAHGLAAAHRQGVIHRDVSPDNIVLPNGSVREAKIIDFGIAKLLDQGEGTILEGFKGKLSYASPEQLGFHGGRVDGRSDFYSLGLVLIAAAMGRPMAMGTTVMEAVDARRALHTLPDAIPVGLRSAIQPLLALDPNDRPEYVDRLFAVPGLESEIDEDGHESLTSEWRGGRAERSGREHASRAASVSTSGSAGDRLGARVGVFAAVAGIGLLLAGGAAYWSVDASEGTPSSAGEAAPLSDEALPTATAAAAAAAAVDSTPTTPTSPRGANQPSALKDPIAALPADAVDVAPVAREPAPRRLRASDRIKIIGLLNNAQLALDEGRLMSPSSDNAYDRYRRVLALDPTNRKARNGLRSVAGRYLTLANRAIDSGDMQKASDFLAKARKADASAPNLATTQARLR